MGRTPGLILPSLFPSEEAFEVEVRRRSDEAGYSEFDPSESDVAVHDFLEHANEDFNLEDEFGYFLERLTYHLEQDVVEHYGVKGMKWGRRRERDPAKEIKGLGPSQITVKTKSGETLTMTKDAAPAIARFLARHRPGYLEKANRFANVTIRDSTGKKVGDASMNKESNDEINLVWLGIKKDERGKGYATAAMKAAVDFGKQSGVKKLTLEVPGNSPDALHIYEKLGFKIGEKLSDEEDDVWGGLTKMELAFDSVSHASEDAVDDFLAHYGVKGMRWGVVKEKATGAREAVGRANTAVKEKRLSRVQGKSDMLTTKISELHVKNETLAEAAGFGAKYKISGNKDLIKDLEKERNRLDRDALAIQEGRLTSTQKKVVVGAVAVGVVLAAGAAYGAKESGAFNAMALRGKAFINQQNSPFQINKDLAGKMSPDDIRAKVAAPVNPNYKKAGGKMNCRRSTFTHELRRRGYDVVATTAATGRGQSESGFINAVSPGGKKYIKGDSVSASARKAFDESIRTSPAKGDKRTNPLEKTLLTGLKVSREVAAARGTLESSSKKVLEEIAKQPNGARGEALFNFGAFAHSVAYEVVDGKAYLFDSQKGKMYDENDRFESKWDGFKTAEITRLDNVDLDLNFLARWSTNKE